MQVVNALHARNVREIVKDLFGINMGRYTGHGEVQRVFQQPPPGNQDEQRYDNGEHRVENIPTSCGYNQP